MKHHFGDLLDRKGEYWHLVPNMERYAYDLGNVPANSNEIRVVTIGRGNENWERIFTFPNLEELTLHEPSERQLASLPEAAGIKRLRITHARAKNLDFLRQLENVEELVLEYVSGFSDLSPLRSMKKLRALHLENLRRVSNFEPLSGLEHLAYLRIDGTLDWKQPIESFEFLRGLGGLEVLSLGQVINHSPFPALASTTALKHLKRILIPSNMISAAEFAFLEVALPGVEGAASDPIRQTAYRSIPLPNDDIRAHLPVDVLKADHPDVYVDSFGQRMVSDPDSIVFEFLGKGSGSIKSRSKNAVQKCEAVLASYEGLKEDARVLIASSFGLFAKRAEVCTVDAAQQR